MPKFIQLTEFCNTSVVINIKDISTIQTTKCGGSAIGLLSRREVIYVNETIEEIDSMLD